MKRLTREVQQVIRLEGWDILVFQMFYRMVTIPVYVWILNKVLRITIDLSGYSFLTVENIRAYFF